MAKAWLDSVIQITSSDPNIHDFGTGFAIHCEGQTTYIATCAHVVEKVGGKANVKVNDIQALVVALDSEDDIDLAVLSVTGLDKTPLPLSVAGEKGRSFVTVGFQLFSRELLFRPLNGVLGEQVQTGVTLAKFTKAWDLKITDDYSLQPGNSGSPVVDIATNTVVGVVRTRQGDGKKGLAISVEALAKIWKEMPASILDRNIHTPSKGSIEERKLPISSAIQELKKVLQIVPSINFERQKLFEELQVIILPFNIPETILEETYYKCVPSDLLHVDTWTYPKQNLLETFQRLNDVPAHGNDISAILSFVIQLTQLVRDPYATMLRQWVNEGAAQVWGVFDNNKLAAYDQVLKISPSQVKVSPVSSHPSLLVTLTPAPIHASSYFVDAWLHCGQQEDLVHLPLTDESSISENLYSPRTISQFIDYILKDMRKCSEYRKLSDEAKGELCIEFFLPYYQLDVEVDNWRFDEGRDRIGRGVRLVVRPLEHIDDQQLGGTPIDEVLWRKKWEKVRNSLQETTLCWIHDCGEFKDEEVHNYINLKRKLDDEKMVCLFAPLVLSKLRLSKKEFFEAIIKTGTPIALWPRKLPIDPVNDLEEMFLSLQGTYPHCIFKLPEIVFQKRRDSEYANKDLYHLGRHLTLLWDDPNKLPPSNRFQQL